MQKRCCNCFGKLNKGKDCLGEEFLTCFSCFPQDAVSNRTEEMRACLKLQYPQGHSPFCYRLYGRKITVLDGK